MSALLNSVQNWWRQISGREQRLVIVCTILLVFGGLYWGLVQPVLQRAEAAQQSIQSEKQLLTWVKEKADEITSLRGQSGQVVSSTPLNQAVSSSARRFNIELLRVQPRDEQLQVWISPLPFNRFAEWMAFLQDTQGITVTFLDIDKGDQNGVVEIKRLQFTKG
ncbi:type II secretion system protein M [Vibrio japonicus]|uniref:Type II secretion system protein M n=1 Tax=Vibrio japonicus TaxID=1824638 RepID=A0ABY5LIB8_9VIBR|nr:type II secretion system protein M [Vibrio japonicus]UUM30517.1 type II secretion system protein M [Vibrio japonicus]